MLLAEADIAALITQAVAAVSGVVVVVLGTLKGLREWLDANAKRQESLTVVPSKNIETKLDVLVSEVHHISGNFARVETKVENLDTKVDSIVQRVVRLETLTET